MKKIRPKPQRHCVACGKTGDKVSFIRLSRTVDKQIEIDISGRKPGRGAYLCPLHGCWEVGLKRRRVEYVLGINLRQEKREELIKEIEGFLRGV